MLKVTLGVVVLIFVFGLVAQFTKTDAIRYVKEEVVTEVPLEAWQTDSEAIQAAKDVIKKKELQAELLKLDTEIKEKQEQRKKVTEELTAYWGDKKRIKQLIRQVFWEDPETAIAVAMAESNLNPYALNAKDSHSGCNGSYGIFQIGCLHETDPSKLYDVEYNIRRAKEIYNDSKWRPWGAHSSGSYKRYLVSL